MESRMKLSNRNWSSTSSTCISIWRLAESYSAFSYFHDSIVLLNTISSNIKSYVDIGEHTYGRVGRVIISIILYIELYMDSTCMAWGWLAERKGLLRSLAFSASLPFGLDDLNILAYGSANVVICFIVVLGSVIYLGAFDGVVLHKKGDIFNLSGMPTALSLYMFCYGAHPVFLTLYFLMQNKHNFSKLSHEWMQHTRLCCNGYLWLFDVCIKYESPNHTKPFNGAKKLTSGNIHHRDHSLGKICTNDEVDCDEY
ncbi:hypothetical protein Cgig2_009945 [Carnegiea gigantea]|uniref:Uncharacterized protein n=1 Tax=Carnegiea gigantea TaxID=171969 RepID=A0A9Q1GQ37_9CARY|nr:hypothetical protein Cgig2_009945 [Carnegiea gigantea]